MKSEWAQSQKDAAHISKFLQSLAKAQGVFADVGEAEAELVRLGAEVRTAEVRLKNTLSKAVQAEASSKNRVNMASETAEAMEKALAVTRSEVMAKRETLEQEVARDRLGFVEFKAKLARQRENAKTLAVRRLQELQNKVAAARASLEAVNVQREKMIADLQTEEMPDVPST